MDLVTSKYGRSFRILVGIGRRWFDAKSQRRRVAKVGGESNGMRNRSYRLKDQVAVAGKEPKHSKAKSNELFVAEPAS
ncbi:MAG: hypothetical protein JWR26_3224 [Pedosphaera sp.]|nr:hypothetical protein [Pedosphaera sp.]